MPPTAVRLYQEDDGHVPLLRWMDALPDKVLAKCRVKLDRLQALGHELRRPEADYLRDDIYELRVRHQRVNYRMLYFFHGQDVVIVSHGLTKERRVPPKEIDLAIERRRKFERDPQKYSHGEM